MKQLIKSLFVLSFMCLAYPVYADDTHTEVSLATEATSKNLLSNNWWLNVGLGGSKSNRSNDFAFTNAYSSINYMPSESRLMTLRAVYGDDISLFTHPKAYIRDIGLMYGLIKKKQYYYASISAGLGYFEFQHYTSCHSSAFIYSTCIEAHNHKTVGIPAELQLFLTPIPYVGIGIIGFGNVNTENTYAGAALALQIGNLW